jgi:4-hydroxythreonine-4-phosphate dehydrogenase
MSLPIGTGTRSLLVTQGDPLGVGPDLILMAASADLLRDHDWVYAGLDTLVERCNTLMANGCDVRRGLERVRGLLAPGLENRPTIGQFGALTTAVDAILQDPVRALVTAPIDKARAAQEGLTFPGHTEYLAERANVDDFAMMMFGPQMRVVLATIHMALSEVPKCLSPDRIVRAGVLLAEALSKLCGLTCPRIGILGVNPHAGEKGLLGREEIDIIEPAIEILRQRLGAKAEIFGPLPADTACYQHVQGMSDGLVAMYHDQGLAPFKLIHFHDGVNVTLGLPFLRTSPDHGTAVDLAGTGRVDPRSFFAAISLARGAHS